MDARACCLSVSHPSIFQATGLRVPGCLHCVSLASTNGYGRRGTYKQPTAPFVAFCHLVGREESRAREEQQKRKEIEQQQQQQQQQHRRIAPSKSEGHANRRKLLSGLRLRARIRLLRRSLYRWSFGSFLHGVFRHMRLHSRQVALSTLFGCTLAMGCLWLKLTSSAGPQAVPYSELVSHLRSGAVTSVLFEEGSRQVFFNLRTNNEQAIQKKTGASSDINAREGPEADMSGDSLDSGPQHGNTLASTYQDSMQNSMPATTDVGPSSMNESVVSMLMTSFKTVSSVSEQLLKSQPHPWRFSTRRIEHDESYLLSLMREGGVTYSSAPQPMSAALRTTLITIFSLWIPLTPLFWLMHRQFSGSNAIAQKRRISSPAVKFEDVAGVDEAKVELMEIVSCLRGATNFRQVGAKLPKGVLLVGPPGTGKTLLARAVAGEARVPFFAASASEFVEMFVGRGAARIRELFAGARKCAPSIIFIDELDAVGGRRGRSFNDERDQTLNQLLTEMDGFESDTGVLVMAATNRPDALDPALCRPGRFSRKVFIREPDLNGRQQVLAVHMRGVPIDGDADFIQIAVASLTQGFVGADLANVVNEAALLAVREGRSAVSLDDFKVAVNRVKFGIGNQPGFVEREVGRLLEWLQPKALKPAPLGYETAPGSG